MAQIHAQRDNPVEGSGTCSFSTRVLLGRRDDEVLEVGALPLRTHTTPLLPNECVRTSRSHARIAAATRGAQVYARTLIELISQHTAVPLLLAISIREHSNEMFRAVLRELNEHRVW